MTYDESCAILGVKRGSSKEEITKAYRKKALLNHPDKGGDKAKFQQLLDAKDTLLNPPQDNSDRILAEYLRQVQAMELKLKKELEEMITGQIILAGRVGSAVLYIIITSALTPGIISLLCTTIPLGSVFIFMPQIAAKIREKRLSK